MTTPRKPTWKLYRDERGEHHIDPRPNCEEVLASDCEFSTTMKLESAWGTHFWFRDLRNNQRHMMRTSEVDDLLQNHTIIKGHVTARFGFVKKGRILSIKVVRELTEEEEEVMDSNAS